MPAINPHLTRLTHPTLLLAAAALTFHACDTHAWQPQRPLRLIVPFPPGGSSDTVARIVAQRAGERFGQTIIIDNRSGGSGAIGVEIAAGAAPDGHTWVLGTTSTHAITPATSARQGYDPLASFAPLGLLGDAPYFVVTHPAVPAVNVKELIAYARAHPGKLNYASAGNASLAHFAGVLFQLRAQAELTHVPYKGSAPALVDLLAGRVQMQFGSIAPALPHLQSGRLKALAVTSLRRVSAAPNVPTVAESGLPDYEAVLWMALFAPAGTPSAVVAAINQTLTQVLAQETNRAALLAQGLEPRSSTPAALTAFVRGETRKWREVAANVGAR
jgi:tripartite-type tricarboxylate transporter receptor subunit TctC